MSEILRARDIHKEYQMGSTRLHVLKGIDLSVEGGEILTIVGASGAGKSTLLHILGILDRPTSGLVFYRGANLNELSPTEQAKKRNELFGFVFQFYHLLPDFNALENVLIPQVIAHGFFGWQRSKRQQKNKAADVLAQVGLQERLNHKPNQLSGGEKQRVAIARALVNDPEILLCDEPTGNLDSTTSGEIHELILRLNKEFNQTVIIVSHDEELARLGDRTARIADGKIVDGKS